jgi:hypothetical protein
MRCSAKLYLNSIKWVYFIKGRKKKTAKNGCFFEIY